MENEPKQDDEAVDKVTKETEGFTDRHPVLATFIVVLVFITIWAVSAAIIPALMDNNKSSVSLQGNEICVGADCVVIPSNCAKVETSYSEESDDGSKPTFDETGVDTYTFTVQSKENLYDGPLDCSGESCFARIETEAGYTLKINLADDRQDYYKLYDDLKVGHTYTYDVRDDKTSPSGFYAIIFINN